MFSLQFTTKVRIGDLEIAIIAKKEEPMTRQIKLFFDPCGIVHTRTNISARRSFTVYVIQFIVNVLIFGTGRSGCCCLTAPPVPCSVLVREELAEQRVTGLPHPP
jgi:hypothetical protein